MYTFHKSVQGHLHILRELPCEDYSGSFSDEKGRYYIAAIADGHGDPACFRSNRGSRFAIEIAIACLRAFAESVYENDEARSRYENILLTDSRARESLIRHLTDTITAKWTDCVYCDLENDQPNEDERDDNYKENERRGTLEHIYGTTLIAGLMLPSFLLLVHQGDGRCDVFYSDGHVDQPIPWDDRCVDTATTSLCDSDVMESFRHCVINTKEKPVIACFLGSDGVEDAYRDSYEDMAGVHTFYKDILVHACTLNDSEFNSFLEEMLPEFSAVGRFSHSGSGDDVSVAGIVYRESAKPFLLQYQKDIQRYQLQEELFWKKDELRGKVRKHDILRNRLQTALDDFNKGISESKEIEQRTFALNAKAVSLVEEIIHVKSEMEANAAQAEEVVREINGESSTDSIMQTRMLGGKRGIKDFLDNFSKHKDSQQRKYKALLEKHRLLKEEIKQSEKELSSVKNSLEDKRKNFQVAKEKYEEYDAKYNLIEKKIQEIEERITALDAGETSCELKKGEKQEVEQRGTNPHVPEVHVVELKEDEGIQTAVEKEDSPIETSVSLDDLELNHGSNKKEPSEEEPLDE